MRSDEIRHLAIGAILTVALTGAPLGAWAGEQTMRLDPEATDIRFELGAMLHTVHGTAQLESGVVRFDPVTGEASGRVVVDARSLDTDNAKRDKKMHTKVLDSDRYPEIVLEIHGFSGDLDDPGVSEALLSATIHLHGEGHAVELPFTLEIDEGAEPHTGSASADSPASPRSARLSTAFTIPYVAWGLKNPSTVFLKVKKQVEISIEATAVLLP